MNSAGSQPASASWARNVSATAPFTQRPPSPPYIHIPSIAEDGRASMSILPSFDGVNSSHLTQEDLEIITQGKPQFAQDTANIWRYEMRRAAQPILDFLYLGPASAVKDHEFLKREGITMLLAVMDAKFAGSLMSVKKTAESLGLAYGSVEVDMDNLNHVFRTATRTINDHLLDIYRGQAISPHAILHSPQDGKIIIDTASFKRGKVFVCCETGNDRSAAVAAAYLIDVFGANMVTALQFVGLQRFCTSFSDDIKNKLRTYEDILTATRDVSRVRHLHSDGRSNLAYQPVNVAQGKRSIDDAMEIDGEEGSGAELDEERYNGRDFAPFVES
ncbi:protein-tyrosine phosphatase-like protein [Podospora didyma]|uniref:Protein-tyrosine phosphatase-like protein n=1 Tax=Podospora didyma TaxID=330526 RepID=A0AAE0NZE9_9PEZI|nr:protein-tyrosine phosphatase-like protein [Podospora didyma]